MEIGLYFHITLFPLPTALGIRSLLQRVSETEQTVPKCGL